jgi:hypothetical protein
MLARDITYRDLNGKEVTKKFYFHLEPAEIVEMELSYNGGLTGFIERVSQTNDNATLIKEFKNIILTCYGVRDGDDFIKNQDLRDRFSGSGAYSALFMEFLQKPGAIEEFINGVVPQEEQLVPPDLKPPTTPIPPPPMPAATVEAGRALVQDAGIV